MKKTLFLRFFLGYAAVIVLLAAAVLIVAPPLLQTHHNQERAADLKHMAYLLEGQVLPHVTGAATGDLEALITDLGRKTGARITVIGPDGAVLADSEKEPRDMENHLFRPEIQASLRGETQTSIRRSSTLKADMMYLSIPLRDRGRIAGALRLSLFMKDIEAVLKAFRRDLWRVVGLVTLIAFVLAFFLTRSVAKPVREVIDASKRVAAGDFDVRVSTRRSGELRDHALAFNAMAGRLKDMFGEIRLQNEEIVSILASIREGLCVLDGDARIVLCNASFLRLAGRDAPQGLHFWEVVRSSSAMELVRKAREGGGGAAGEVVLGERAYYCSIARLAEADRLVLTLHDVTEFRALEKTKRDFVANVTHELKTPLTAIKGFVETMEPRTEAENRPYLEIIGRNTDRLIAIVEDLLVLSELEAPGMKPVKEDLDARPLAGNILKLFERRAADKGIRLVLEAPPGLPAVEADRVQLEGLLLNLVDNAVKYTDRGTVTVRLGAKEGRFVVEVADTGVGIDADHLPHIFERFYVADKSRSRKLGGTGLGLSIVKHIAQAHGGGVSVRSRLGEGTTVTVELPLA
ncbi:MAG: ATP-binding protein [Acidobacteriota bacterium]